MLYWWRRQVRAEDGPIHAVFPVEAADQYFRLTVTVSKGLHACTNAYFTDEWL